MQTKKATVRKKIKKAVMQKLGLVLNAHSRVRIAERLALAGFKLAKNESMPSLYLRFLNKTHAQFCAEAGIDPSEAKVSNRPWLAKHKAVISAKRKRMPIGAPHPDYVRGDKFYSCKAWRELRYLALKNTDGKCQACGGSAKDDLRIHVDHIIPRYKRPDLALALDNLQVLCEDCNIGKGAWDQTDWRSKL